MNGKVNKVKGVRHSLAIVALGSGLCHLKPILPPMKNYLQERIVRQCGLGLRSEKYSFYIYSESWIHSVFTATKATPITRISNRIFVRCESPDYHSFYTSILSQHKSRKYYG